MLFMIVEMIIPINEKFLYYIPGEESVAHIRFFGDIFIEYLYCRNCPFFLWKYSLLLDILFLKEMN